MCCRLVSHTEDTFDNRITIPNDVDCAERVFPDEGEEQFVGEWDVFGGLVLHPLLEIVVDEDDVALAPARLRQVRLKASLAQVLLASCCDGIFVVLEAA